MKLQTGQKKNGKRETCGAKDSAHNSRRNANNTPRFFEPEDEVDAEESQPPAANAK